MLAVIAATLVACGMIRPAAMRLPDGIKAVAAPVPVEGIGGGQRGSYRYGDSFGGFVRSDTRLGIGGWFESRGGVVRLTIEGPLFAAPLQAGCTVRERSLTLGVIGFTPSPLAYRCDFEGRDAAFELQAAQGVTGGASLRRGRVAVGNATVEIASVHAFEGSPLPAATPIGYAFHEGGRAIGAVELNGVPRAFAVPGLAPDLQRALVIGTVVLAVFWDPAESALGGP